MRTHPSQVAPSSSSSRHALSALHYCSVLLQAATAKWPVCAGCCTNRRNQWAVSSGCPQAHLTRQSYQTSKAHNVITASPHQPVCYAPATGARLLPAATMTDKSPPALVNCTSDSVSLRPLQFSPSLSPPTAGWARGRPGTESQGRQRDERDAVAQLLSK